MFNRGEWRATAAVLMRIDIFVTLVAGINDSSWASYLLNEPQVLDLMMTHKVTSGIFHWISLKNFNTLIEN